MTFVYFILTVFAVSGVAELWQEHKVKAQERLHTAQKYKITSTLSEGPRVVSYGGFAYLKDGYQLPVTWTPEGECMCNSEKLPEFNIHKSILHAHTTR